MADTEKKVDESWKDQVAHEKDGDQAEREEETARDSAQDPGAGFPPVQAGFITLVAELAMQASWFMGEITDPESKEPVEDLNRAKYLIDELGVLEEKTKGNLTSDESAALKNVLYDLRMKYVKKEPKL
jgi:hypothetical protein